MAIYKNNVPGTIDSLKKYLSDNVGAIFKINTRSEENFLSDFADLIERYKKEAN